MNKIKLYRKRLIPDECIYLEHDEIIMKTDSVIMTKWNTIRPKVELSHGFSCYFLEEGYKVSKFYKKDGSLLYWYCDIISYEFISVENTYVFVDLLVDVIVFSDGFVKVVDIDELARALDEHLISADLLKLALIRLQKLLSVIYDGEFYEIQNFINQTEKGNGAAYP